MAARFMDPLAGDSDPSTSGTDSEAEAPVKQAAKQQPEVDVEALVSGQSVLFVPEPKQEGEQDWNWGSGAAHKDAGGDNVTREDREATREAVTSGLEQSVGVAMKVQQRNAELRQAKRQEALEAAESRRLNFQQREKRKRERGQAKGGGKDYVQEEKRLARNFGVYSNFD